MSAVSQRVFLTHASSRSRSAEAPQTATTQTTTTTCTASIRSTGVPRSRTATAAESTQRMATERQRRADGLRLLARQERASSDMVGYGRRRFVDTCAAEPAPGPGSSPDAVGRAAASGLVSKCALSPYATVVMEKSEAAAAAVTETPRPDSAERRAGQQRARLMNELRLRQMVQPVRYRHDRTAQELVQEGALTGRCRPAAGGYPWPRDYKYTPFPQPSVARWLATERKRTAEAAQAVEEAEAKAAAEATLQTPVLIELAVQAPVELQLPLQLTLLPGDGICEHWQQPRKSSDSLLRPAGLFPAPAGDGAGGKWQRSKSQTAVGKPQHSGRLFSVSSVGEEERSRRRTQVQTLAQVCQRLRDHRATGAAAAVPARDAIDQLADEIECGASAGQLYRQAEADGDPLPLMPCPSSEAKSRQHLTRIWLRRHRLGGTAPPPIIS